ncbi:MAG: GntR family transcriptional regulator [bacterium]|nr:GntR family transcriptional regulator [bacterium]
MHIKLENDNGVPIYMQIIAQVKRQAAAGLLRPGDQLPPVRELALQLRINPNTVARAYRDLRQEGMIDSRWGDGNFISAEAVAINETEKRRIVAGAVEDAIKLAAEMGLDGKETAALFADYIDKHFG